MFTTLLFIPLFISLIHSVFAQSGNFTIDTITLVQCQTTQITWTNTGNSPYDLFVVSADDVCGEAIEGLGNLTSAAMTWDVNIPAGTQVVLFLEDSVGNEAWSGTVTVGNSSDTSCLASASPDSTVSGTPPTSGDTATHSTTSSPTPFAPAGAANAGLGSTSGAMSTRPLSAISLFSVAVLAIMIFAP